MRQALARKNSFRRLRAPRVKVDGNRTVFGIVAVAADYKTLEFAR
jgi:hypothetical protein